MIMWRWNREARTKEYLVRWRGMDGGYDTWESAGLLGPEIINSCLIDGGDQQEEEMDPNYYESFELEEADSTDDLYDTVLHDACDAPPPAGSSASELTEEERMFRRRIRALLGKEKLKV